MIAIGGFDYRAINDAVEAQLRAFLRLMEAPLGMLT